MNVLRDMNALAALLFALCFVAAAFRRAQFQWLWAALVWWLAGGVLSATVLPKILGITHLANAYAPQVYVFLGSLFYFVLHVQREPQTQLLRGGGGAFLTLLAVSGAAMNLAFMLLCGVVAWLYPDGAAAYFPPALIQLYWFEPLHWYAVQLCLMGIFYLHRRANGQSAAVFSSTQLMAGVLLAVFWQAFAVGGFGWLYWLAAA